MRLRSLSLLAAATLVLCSCAGDGPAANTSTDWFSMLQRDVFDVNCLSAGCHNPQSQAGGLVLSEGSSYDELVNVAAQNAEAAADGLDRVTPFDTAGSFLLIKLTDPAPGQGDRMPQGQAPLSPSDIDIVTQWILAGAPPAQTQTAPLGATATPTPTPTVTLPLPSATPTATSTTALPEATATASPTIPPDATPTVPPPSPSPTNTQAVTIADVQAQVFTPYCATQFCHTSTAMAGGMTLEDGASYAALVNVPAVNFAAMNAGLLRVNPGNPDESFLMIKLTNPTLQQGSRMPMGQPPLLTELIDLVRTWIAQGAQD